MGSAFVDNQVLNELSSDRSSTSPVLCQRFTLFLSFLKLKNILKNFHSIVLVSAIQQGKSAMITHRLPPRSHSSRSSQSAWLSSCVTQLLTSCPSHTWELYMLMLFFPSVPLSSFPIMSTSPFSTSVSPFLPCK